MNSVKMKAIFKWAHSQSVKKVHLFLKFINFYKWFIKNFSELTSSLMTFTWKNVMFKWSDEIKAVFKQMKKMFTEISVLMQFNLNHKTIMKTDFFRYVIDELLQQYDDQDFLHLCVFFSYKNEDAECNYEIYNKKLLVIVKCLRE